MGTAICLSIVACTIAVIYAITKSPRGFETQSGFREGGDDDGTVLCCRRDSWRDDFGRGDSLHRGDVDGTMREQQEAVLVGGPSCGMSVLVVAGQWAYTEIRGGVYYRWDRTDRICNGQTVFQIARSIAPGQREVTK